MRTIATVLFVAGATLIGMAAQKGPEDFKGKAMPAFSMKTLSGATVSNKTLKGKVYLLDFWATWCGPCKELSPTIQKLQEKYKAKGFNAYGVTISDPNVEGIKAYPKEHKYTYTFTMGKDNDKLASSLGISGIPAVMVIGKDGLVKEVVIGSMPTTGPTLEAAIKAALK